MTPALQRAEHVAAAWDGTEIFYRSWRPAAPVHKALLLFHRGHEHSGRFQELVDRLGFDDVAIFAWDARGHGRSPGDRGYAEHFGTLVKDVDWFVRHVSRDSGIPVENTVVLAHSVGAVIVSAWLHDHAPPIRAAVLGAPAFRVKLYVPLAIPWLRLLQAMRGRAFITSYVKPRMLTHDPEQAEAYATDPLISRDIAVNILLGLHDTSTRLLADAGAIRTPILLLAAGSDWVVDLGAQRRFFARLGSADKDMEVYPGFFHALFHEKDRQRPIARAEAFIRRAFQEPLRAAPRLDADRAGYTKDEYDRLAAPLSPLSPRGLGFGLMKLSLRTLGRLSAGVRLGWKTGFDSGESLDYVYRNEARGIGPLGRWIDRVYLDSAGWRGIRVRRKHLIAALATAMRERHAAGLPVHLVDLAAGPGRYVLDAIRAAPEVPVTAVLRDRSSRNLEAGRVLAREWGVGGVTYEEGDAFDPAAIAAIAPRPSIAIVSGLYELFPENAPVRRSLQALHGLLVPGGVLIYTNQPWHPQVEFIARVLTNRDGKPWVMRRRTQAEMDDLVREARFDKTGMAIDEDGIFTVSVARRSGA